MKNNEKPNLKKRKITIKLIKNLTNKIMRKKFTMLFAALLACVGMTKAQDQVMGLKKLPETRVDLTQGLETGYYLLKQVNDANDCAGGNGVGWIKAASEAAGKSATSVGTGTPGEDGALYIWYVEVVDAENRLIKISTANKVASWQLPENSQREKGLIAYANATTLQYHNEACVDLGQGANKPKEGSAFISNTPVTSYIHFSGNNLGSWTSSGTNSTYMVEFYAIPTEDLIVYGPVAVAKLELESYIAEVSASLGKIALQTTDANAAGYLSSCGSASAEGNVEDKMIDGKNDTFYGSPWQSSVGQEHYWQVDLGEGVALSEFVFNYVTRNGGTNSPSRITVLGSTDGSTFDATLSTIENLPDEGGARYESEVISNPDAYRYLRFQAYDDEKDWAMNDGKETTIAIAEFELISKDEAIWSEQDKAIKAAVDAAQTVLNSDDATVEAIAEALHNVKMAAVVMPEYPFTVTTDDENPVLYAIKSGRGDAYWYTYDDADGMIALSQYTGATKQWWFFKAVVTEDYQYAVQLYPYADPTKAMSYEDTNDGAAKIVAKTLETAGWTNLWSPVSTDGAAPYGLQTYDKKNYLSNNGGVQNKMGMWHAAPANDGGTAMYFATPAEALQALIDEAEAMTAYEGIVPGYYTAASIAELKTAIEAAKENMANKNYSVTELNAAIAAVEVVPVTAGYYFIQGTGTGNNANWYVTYDNGNFVAKSLADGEKLGAKHVWSFEAVEDGYKLKSCNLGKYANALADAPTVTTVASDYNMGAKFTFTNSGIGTFIIKDGNNGVMRTEGNGEINKWGTENNEKWSLVPVTELEMTINEFASICLPFDVKPGEGVKAYAIESTNSTHAILAEKADIPAGEGAILEGQGTVKLNLTTATSDWESNMLEGTFVDTYVQGAAYVLAKKNDVIGLYKASLNKNEAGEAGETHFKNNANKAYLVVEGTNAPMFSFDRGEGTTGIDNSQLTIDNSAVIYDLAGRRVEKMEKGIYIVNGKKVVK